MQNAQEIQAVLQGHTGSENFFQHGLRKNLIYTDGIRAMAEAAEAYWLVDAISSHQPQALRDESLREIQFWQLRKRENDWLLTCERDAGDVVIQQVIEHTNFPLSEVRLYVCRADDQLWTLMLPSEY